MREKKKMRKIEFSACLLQQVLRKFLVITIVILFTFSTAWRKVKLVPKMSNLMRRYIFIFMMDYDNFFIAFTFIAY
jgi:hypothetical protein